MTLRNSARVFALAVVALLVLLTAGCSSETQATPTPTKTPQAIAVANTPLPPTLTPTLPPTATPAPSATPVVTPTATFTPTATLTPTADPSLLIPARDPSLSPFTGLRPADPAVLQRRPVALKVDNDPAVVPQSGLDKADVVVESPKEGCKTRFTAVYQSQDATRVGSIRSARLIDLELPVIFDAIMAFSGGVQPVRRMLYDSDIGDHILEQALNGPAFFRDPNIAVPFNLFADTRTLWNVITKRGWNQAPKPTAAWAFSEAAPAGGAAASRVDVPYKDMKVAWTYDPASGRWQRLINGKPHIDKVSGQQLSAADVVVLAANNVDTLILEQGTVMKAGPCSNRSVEIQLWGEGPLKILRDGKVYEGKWVRPERHGAFRFVDASGQDIPLKPGNSWWEIVPMDMKVAIAQ